MGLAGRKGEMDRQAIGVHDRVNLADEAPSQATHILMIIGDPSPSISPASLRLPLISARL
jgi:hypothetical protein